MALTDLPAKQQAFITAFLKVPKRIGRKKATARREVAIREFGRFNVQKSAVETRINAIADPDAKSKLLRALDAAEGLIGTDPKNLNFDAATQRLVDIDKVVRDQNAQTAARAKYDIAVRRMAAVESGPGLDNIDEIKFIWAFADGKFQKGIKSNDQAALTEADKGFDQLFRTIDAGRPDITGEGAESKRTLRDVGIELGNLRNTLQAGFPDGLPTSMEQLLDAVDTALGAGDAASVADLPNAATGAETALAAAKTAADTLASDRAAWDALLGKFMARYDVMGAHPLASDTDYVQPKFLEVTDVLTAATQKARVHNYSGATTDLTPAMTAVEEAMVFADDHKTFNDILEARRTLVGTLPAENTRTFDQVKNAITAAEALITDAEALRRAGDMTEALKKLSEVLSAVPACESLIEREDYYNRKWTDTSDQIAEYESDANVAALMSDDITLLKNVVNSSKAKADGGDIENAADLLDNFVSYRRVMVKRADLCDEYLEEKEAFLTRLRAIRNIDGRIAVEAFYQDLKQDRIRMNRWEAKKDVSLALEAATLREGMQDRMVARAALGKQYEDLLGPLDIEIARLDGGAPGAAAANDVTQVAKDTKADALDFRQREDWFQAVRRLQDATNVLATATLIAKNSKTAEDMVDDAKVANIGTNLPEAMAQFTALHTAVSNQDADGNFGTALDAAASRADGAQRLASATPPDAAAAQTELTAAIAAVKDVLTDIQAYGRYTTQRTAIKSLFNDLKKNKQHKLVQPELDQASTHLETAKTNAEQTPPDYKAALAALAEAKGEVRKGFGVTPYAETYSKNLRTLKKFSEKTLTKAPIPTIFVDEITRFNALIGDIEQDFTDRRMTDMSKKLGQAVALQGSYAVAIKDYGTARKLYDKHVAGQLGPEMTHIGATEQAAKVQTAKDALDLAMTNHNFVTAIDLVWDVFHSLKDCKAAAAAHDAWVPMKTDATAALKEITDRNEPDNGPGVAKIAELQAVYDKAIAEETRKNYSGAGKRLTGFADLCDAAKPLFDTFDLYVLSRDAGQKAITDLKSAGTDGIEPLLKRIEAKRDNALSLATGFSFDAARVLMDELQKDCATATSSLQRLEGFEKVSDVIKTLSDDDVATLEKAIRAATALHGQISTRPSALFVHDDMKTTGDTLATAARTAAVDAGQAKTYLDQAMAECVRLTKEMGRFDQFTDTYDLASRLLHEVDTGSQSAFTHDDAVRLRKQANDGMNATRSDPSKRSATHTVFETVISETRELMKLQDTHALWADAFKRVSDAAATLEAHADRHHITNELKLIRAALTESTTKANAKDHAEAHKQIAKAESHIAQANLELKVRQNKAPSVDELKVLLAAPDGHKLLDDVVKRLDESTQRKVMNVAFEARFGCKLDLFASPRMEKWGFKDKNLKKKAPNIMRFYDLMSDLPPASTTDNDSMEIFSHTGDKATGSYYSTDGREVAMREGEAKDSPNYGYGLEHELGKTRDQLHLEDGPPMTYFSWNTLHEVGHAVDDKLSFMTRNGAALAGWEELGSNVRPIAVAIASDTNFDADYLTEYISKGKGSRPPLPPPAGCSDEEWERRRIEACAWIDGVRESNNPWANDAVAKLAKTSTGKVYHEAYPGSWVGYNYSARAEGVSGYQFRAPGEWFSELYAAVHSKKLKNSHTHYDRIAAAE